MFHHSPEIAISPESQNLCRNSHKGWVRIASFALQGIVADSTYLAKARVQGLGPYTLKLNPISPINPKVLPYTLNPIP